MLRTLAGGSGASFSVLSCSEFSAVLESSEEDSYLRVDRKDTDGDGVGGIGVTSLVLGFSTFYIGGKASHMLGKYLSEIHTPASHWGIPEPMVSISNRATRHPSQPPLDLHRLQSHRSGPSKVHIFLYLSFLTLYSLCFHEGINSEDQAERGSHSSKLRPRFLTISATV